jgi:hypothetical protein
MKRYLYDVIVQLQVQILSLLLFHYSQEHWKKYEQELLLFLEIDQQFDLMWRVAGAAAVVAVVVVEMDELDNSEEWKMMKARESNGVVQIEKKQRLLLKLNYSSLKSQL